MKCSHELLLNLVSEARLAPKVKQRYINDAVIRQAQIDTLVKGGYQTHWHKHCLFASFRIGPRFTLCNMRSEVTFTKSFSARSSASGFIERTTKQPRQVCVGGRRGALSPAWLGQSKALPPGKAPDELGKAGKAGKAERAICAGCKYGKRMQEAEGSHRH